ncbi:E3 ubiquitin-protein ligase KEG-like isoform X2 [Apium graveolens]|uniref:E3 ubiquitin-protein ligase KEG-like isoform X2 n=1 Tax=Apium graveolens TaxID=4045 RepID=UPI003D7B4425
MGVLKKWRVLKWPTLFMYKRDPHEHPDISEGCLNILMDKCSGPVLTKMQRNGGRLTLDQILRMQTAILVLISSGVAFLMAKTNSAPVTSLYFHPNNGDLIYSCDSLDEIR